MAVRLPLSVLLSKALIALNQEFERAGAGVLLSRHTYII
jgi:hypothetical protein